MAPHNPLAAKPAAEAGFEAIWGSGFVLSAPYAVPDADEADIAPVSEIFALRGDAPMWEIEKTHLR